MYKLFLRNHFTCRIFRTFGSEPLLGSVLCPVCQNTMSDSCTKHVFPQEVIELSHTFFFVEWDLRDGPYNNDMKIIVIPRILYFFKSTVRN